MPLSKVKQAEYQRERRRKLGMTQSTVIPKPHVIPNIEGLRMRGNIILGVKPKSNLNAKPDVKPKLYNPSIHKPGDTVLMRSPFTN